MKFTCSQGALTRALNTVSKAVSIRTTIPILKGILLSVKGNELTVTASDLDLSIETKLEVQGAEDGSTVVSSKLFSEIIRKLPNAIIQVEEEEGKMEIACLGSHFSIVSLPADEFPAIGMVNQLNKISVKKDVFKELIKKTTFAASIDEKKGILVGCLLKFTGEKLEMAALDGFRLAVASDEMKTDGERSVVIPARILVEIQKILMESAEEEEISLILDSKKAEIITKDTRIVARLLEGEFIKYADIIPKTYKTRCIVSREEMLSGIERASLLAKEGKNNLIKLDVSGSRIEITSRSEEGNSKEVISTECEGDELVIGFNSKYVSDVLKAVGDEEVVLEMSSPVSPCLIKPVKLENFRNYGNQTIEFHEKLNLLLGQNAQGKTNLLESLFIMGLGKSFRTNKDSDMIAFGKDFARASCVVDGEKDETSIDILYQKEGKIIKVDGVKLSRSIDLLEHVYIVVFSPEDLKIIKEGPEHRRRFLDRELCQIKPVYYSDLGNYKKVLKQRNFLLREKNPDKNLFNVFDASLADYGTRIVKERKEFTKRLQDLSSRIHSDISQGKETLAIEYETKVEGKEAFRELLAQSFESDVYKGFTSFGPHKDDLKIEVNGTDIRTFGSQGQQRTAALSMKLAEIGLIRQETGCSAVLLLDDVLSELDSSRQRFLIESMKDIQVFITATEIDPQVKALLPAGFEFIIEQGFAKMLT